MTATATTVIKPVHYLNITGVKPIATPALREINTAVSLLKNSGGLLVINGEPGLGKTYGTQVALAKAGLPVHWCDMSGTPTGKEAVSRIFCAVTGNARAPRITEYLLIEDTVDVLSGLHSALVIDEAQHLTTSAMRQIRYLHDRPTTTSLFILIGSRVTKRLRSVPELESRVASHVEVKPLPSSEVTDTAKRLHPILSASDDEALAILAKSAGGSMRSWAKIVFHAQQMKMEALSVADAHRIVKVIGGS